MANNVLYDFHFVHDFRDIFEYRKECAGCLSYGKECAGCLSVWPRMCGIFVSIAKNVRDVCQYGQECGVFFKYGNDYMSFSIWQRIFLLIQYGNIFSANCQCNNEHAIYSQYRNEC
jgi:hypothetical protein